MTTTITREERERVAKLWFADWAAEIIARDGAVASDFSKEISIADIDRVAQALRDAAPQWREVTETEPAVGEWVLCHLHWRQVGGTVDTAMRTLIGAWRTGSGHVTASDPSHWMPLPAPPESKPAPAPAPQAVAQPGASEAALCPCEDCAAIRAGAASEAARIEALERTVAELALAVERLTEKG